MNGILCKMVFATSQISCPASSTAVDLVAVIATMLEPPHTVAGPGGALEVSVHRLGRDVHAELAAVLPDAPHSQGLLAALTFQFASDGVQWTADPHAVDSPPTAAQVCLLCMFGN